MAESIIRNIATSVLFPDYLAAKRPPASIATIEIKVASIRTRAYFAKLGMGHRIMAKLSHGFRRRVFTCALAYALAIQGFIFALQIGGSAFAADSTAWAGFELCTRNGVSSTPPSLPVQDPLGNIHCVFCIAGAFFLNSPPPSPPPSRELAFTHVGWRLAPVHLAAIFIVESAWPRGPPAAA